MYGVIQMKQQNETDQQHCELESGYCRVYHRTYTQEYRRDKPCPCVKCKHDTRTHSAATETITYEEVGDIVDQAVETSKRQEHERVLAKQRKIIEDMRLLSFQATQQHIEAISLYDAMKIVKQRLGELND